MENTEQEDLVEGTKKILLDITRQRETLVDEREDLQAKIDQLDKTDQHLRRIQVQLRNLLGGGEVKIQIDPEASSGARKHVSSGRKSRNPHRKEQIIKVMQESDKEWWAVAELVQILGGDDQLMRNDMERLREAGRVEKKRHTEMPSGLPRVSFRLSGSMS